MTCDQAEKATQVEKLRNYLQINGPLEKLVRASEERLPHHNLGDSVIVSAENYTYAFVRALKIKKRRLNRYQSPPKVFESCEFPKRYDVSTLSLLRATPLTKSSFDYPRATLPTGVTCFPVSASGD